MRLIVFVFLQQTSDRIIHLGAYSPLNPNLQNFIFRRNFSLFLQLTLYTLILYPTLRLIYRLVLRISAFSLITFAVLLPLIDNSNCHLKEYCREHTT